MIQKALLILVAVAASGCSSKVTSNKAPDFSEKITKLYVTVKGSESAKPFFDTFIANFNALLNEKGVSMNDYIFDPLSLDEQNELKTKIDAFQPNLIMVINQTESRKTVNNNFHGPGVGGGPSFGFGGSAANTGATFDVKIYEPNSNKLVWRASLKADGQFGLKSAAKKATEKLIEKLVQDSLL